MPNQSIGAILVNAGRLTTENAEHVLRHQRQTGLQFGAAAVDLGLVSTTDIQFALSRQFAYPYLLRGESPVHETVIAAYDPFSAEVEALRALRTQLLLRLEGVDSKRPALAIVSAQSGDGRSYLAANLAVVFSQLGERTLLIDGDMRSPRQHVLLGLENRTGLSAILSGRSGFEAIQRIPTLVDLSLLSAGAIPPNPQELLGRPIFKHLLDEVSSQFKVVIIDTPASAVHAEALTVASRAGSAVIVARKDFTRLHGIRDMSQLLAGASIPVIGAVLNEF